MLSLMFPETSTACTWIIHLHDIVRLHDNHVLNTLLKPFLIDCLNATELWWNRQKGRCVTSNGRETLHTGLTWALWLIELQCPFAVGVLKCHITKRSYQRSSRDGFKPPWLVSILQSPMWSAVITSKGQSLMAFHTLKLCAEFIHIHGSDMLGWTVSIIWVPSVASSDFALKPAMSVSTAG